MLILGTADNVRSIAFLRTSLSMFIVGHWCGLIWSKGFVFDRSKSILLCSLKRRYFGANLHTDLF